MCQPLSPIRRPLATRSWHLGTLSFHIAINSIIAYVIHTLTFATAPLCEEQGRMKEKRVKQQKIKLRLVLDSGIHCGRLTNLTQFGLSTDNSRCYMPDP